MNIINKEMGEEKGTNTNRNEKNEHKLDSLRRQKYTAVLNTTSRRHLESVLCVMCLTFLYRESATRKARSAAL
jgi:hypothetical protein